MNHLIYTEIRYLEGIQIKGRVEHQGIQLMI